MAIFDLLDEYEQIQLRIIVTLENMPAPVITTVSELSRLLGASEFVIKKAVHPSLQYAIFILDGQILFKF